MGKFYVEFLVDAYRGKPAKNVLQLGDWKGLTTPLLRIKKRLV
jgi:hypothetical protein